MMIVGTMLRHCPDSGSVMGVSPRLAEPHPFSFATGGPTAANGVELEAAKQIACEQEQKRSQQSLKAVVGNHGYRDIGISNQKREDRKKYRKDKGHLRWCCQAHALSPKKTSAERRSARPRRNYVSVKAPVSDVSSRANSRLNCFAFADPFLVVGSAFANSCLVSTVSEFDRSSLEKRTLFASRTLMRISKSSAFFRRAETSSEPDSTDTR